MTSFIRDRKEPPIPISLASISALVGLLPADGGFLDISLIERRFRERAIGFDRTAGTLVSIEVLRHVSNGICGGRAYTGARAALDAGDQAFCKFIVGRLSVVDSALGCDVRETLAAFRFDDGYATARMRALAGKHYLARDLLLESGAIRRDNEDGSFRIQDWFFDQFVTLRFGIGTDPDALDSKLAKQTELGLKAELAALTFEQSIVPDADRSTVVHISQFNVGAGFDIASTRRDEGTNHLRLRLIEVKAVSEQDWAFTFTRNEVSKAAESGDVYFLYLIPVIRGRPTVGRMQVVQDPVGNLQQDEQWDVQEGDWLVQRTKTYG